MAKFAKLSFQKDELNKKASGFFKGMLENGVVAAVLVPMAQAKNGVRLTLITSADHTAEVDPFAPIAAVSGAKIASALTSRPSGRKIAMVLRPCEMRAVVELAKLKQVNLDDVLLIGMDCLGRYENTDFAKFQEQGGTSESFLGTPRPARPPFKISISSAPARSVNFPRLTDVDMLDLCAIGAGNRQMSSSRAITEKGWASPGKIRLEVGEAPAGRDEAVKKLVAVRTEAREKNLPNFGPRSAPSRRWPKNWLLCQLLQLPGCLPCPIARNVYSSRIPSGTPASSS